MARVRSKNQCSCCKKSSSSERPSSSSTDPSYDPPSSSDPSSDDPSSDDPSSSSGSGEVGRCCSIPTRYIVDSEIYESNDYEGAQEWIRSQRSGREGVGFMFHGPIRLRFDGGWFVAVICVGEEQEDGTCDCDIQKNIYDCTETDDPGYCYYLAGIPGLGVFTPEADCECDGSNDGQANTSEGCDKCAGSFVDCELGCGEEGCSCCWEKPPPPTADGVICTNQFRILSYSGIQESWPEILNDRECGFPGTDGDSAWGRLVEYCVEAFNIEGDSIHVVIMRDSSDPCRFEVWGACSCIGQANGRPDTTCGDFKIYQQKAGGGEFSVENTCDCKIGNCRDKCYDKDDLDIDVLDEWQAAQISGEFFPGGECPTSCCPDEADCDDSFLEPYSLFEEAPASSENLNGGDSKYEFNTDPDPVEGVDFIWNDKFPKELCNYQWVTERVINNAFCFDTFDFYTASSECYRAYLISCDPVEGEWIDVTDEAVTGLPVDVDLSGGPCADSEVASSLDWGFTARFEGISGEESCLEGCNTGVCTMPEGWEFYETGKFGDMLPYSYRGGRKEKQPMKPMTKATNKSGGAGTELSNLLGFFGINAKEKGCKCKSRAAKMDKNGVEWCANNVEKICDWLQEEAQKRKLPFLRTAAKIIVLRAVRNARAKGFE